MTNESRFGNLRKGKSDNVWPLRDEKLIQLQMPSLERWLFLLLDVLNIVLEMCRTYEHTEPLLSYIVRMENGKGILAFLHILDLANSYPKPGWHTALAEILEDQTKHELTSHWCQVQPTSVVSQLTPESILLSSVYMKFSPIQLWRIQRAARNHPPRSVPEFVSIHLADLLEAFPESELLPSGNTKAQKTN